MPVVVIGWFFFFFVCFFLLRQIICLSEQHTVNQGRHGHVQLSFVSSSCFSFLFLRFFLFFLSDSIVLFGAHAYFFCIIWNECYIPITNLLMSCKLVVYFIVNHGFYTTVCVFMSVFMLLWGLLCNEDFGTFYSI